LHLLTARGSDIAAHVITDYVPLTDAPTVLTKLAASRHTGLQLVFTGR
jgi:hypothetical protein